MCSCEPGWTCPQCRGTRLADRYPDLPDEREAAPARRRALAEAYGDDTGE